MNDLARLILICIKDIQFLRKEYFVNANVWLKFCEILDEVYIKFDSRNGIIDTFKKPDKS
jgi:hypothetical protein